MTFETKKEAGKKKEKQNTDIQLHSDTEISYLPWSICSLNDSCLFRRHHHLPQLSYLFTWFHHQRVGWSLIISVHARNCANEPSRKRWKRVKWKIALDRSTFRTHTQFAPHLACDLYTRLYQFSANWTKGLHWQMDTAFCRRFFSWNILFAEQYQLLNSRSVCHHSVC